jgi:hypothetical protein
MSAQDANDVNITGGLIGAGSVPTDSGVILTENSTLDGGTFSGFNGGGGGGGSTPGGNEITFGNVIFTKLRDEEAYDQDGNSLGNYREYSWAFDVEPTGTGTVSYTMQQQAAGSSLWFNIQNPNYNTGDAASSLRVAATDSTGTYYLSVSWPTE